MCSASHLHVNLPISPRHAGFSGPWAHVYLQHNLLCSRSAGMAHVSMAMYPCQNWSSFTRGSLEHGPQVWPAAPLSLWSRSVLVYTGDTPCCTRLFDWLVDIKEAKFYKNLRKPQRNSTVIRWRCQMFEVYKSQSEVNSFVLAQLMQQLFNQSDSMHI